MPRFSSLGRSNVNRRGRMMRMSCDCYLWWPYSFRNPWTTRRYSDSRATNKIPVSGEGHVHSSTIPFDIPLKHWRFPDISIPSHQMTVDQSSTISLVPQSSTRGLIFNDLLGINLAKGRIRRVDESLSSLPTSSSALLLILALPPHELLLAQTLLGLLLSPQS